ncbi:IclR family transcriptional regulator [Georgenia sp. AZ-5]|uniref:IclR family transcriptional regulator n=1 Tax=Georgenia sp. AZ-5 TaxID=3367526 RepID=UPI0037550869
MTDDEVVMPATSAQGEDAANEPAARQGTARRLLAVLLAFEQDTQPLSLSEAARRADLPTSTVLRMLRELCDVRFLERVDGNRYQIGARLFELGMRAPVQRTLREVALPVMEDLYGATRENVHLGILDPDGVLVIQQLTGKRSVRTPASSGARLPAHATANGKTLLAFAAPQLVEQVLQRGLPRITQHTICSRRELEEQLQEIRERGWAMAKQENSLGTMSVGAPVIGLEGHAIASLSLVVPVNTSTEVQRFAHAVRTAANTISRLWAHTHPLR